MRQAVSKKMAMVIGLSALIVLAGNLLQTAGIFSPPAAVAQEEKNPDEPAVENGEKAPAADTASKPKGPDNLLVFFFESLGWRYTIAFLIISFTFVAYLVMNILSLRRDSICPKHLAEAFEAQLNEKKFQEAYDLAKNDESMLGQVLSAGMQNLQNGYDKAVEAMGQVGEEENMKLEQRLSMISLVASIGPMVGLLGTVDGMVASFMVIAGSDVTPKPSELAKGVSTALITTVVGLVLAIPAIIAFNLMKNRMARLVLEVGQVVGQLMGRFENMNVKK